jgi:UDP-N-acetyl-D-mannosaminuronate dehydrogenase
MLDDLRKYTKFVGGVDKSAGAEAAAHFESIGLKTKVLSSAEAAEIAKLSETTYFGLLIAWAQEVQRYADLIGVSYDEIVSFYEEVAFFPAVKYFPGVIGGHCVMPNIELLRRFDDSEILRAIRSSNEKAGLRESSLTNVKQR